MAKEIKLTQGLVAIVDDDMYEGLSAYKWHVSKSGATYYAVRHILPASAGLGKMKMHHQVIGKPENGLVVDHIDGNGLNNTKENLRFVTVRENQQNQKLTTLKKHSKYPGVSLFSIKEWTRWVAGAKINGKRKTIGYFDTEEEAYAAYLQTVSANEIRSSL
jgi:hypothetical protein